MLHPVTLLGYLYRVTHYQVDSILENTATASINFDRLMNFLLAKKALRSSGSSLTIASAEVQKIRLECRRQMASQLKAVKSRKFGSSSSRETKIEALYAFFDKPIYSLGLVPSIAPKCV